MPPNERIRHIQEIPRSGKGNKLPVQEVEIKREYYFRARVLSHLLNTMRESLENSGFSESEIDEFSTELAKLPKDDQFTVLAVPFEVREKLFENYHDKIDEGQISVVEAVEDILQKNKRFGFTVGYHISGHEIPKEQSSKSWNVKGSEFDDRDEMKMAYYSEDYLNRYKKKPGKYLYIVRAEIGPTTAHKKDQSNRWSRAPLLSIIDECDMREIEREINEDIAKESAASEREAA